MRYFRKHSAPNNSHRLVRELVDRMNDERVTRHHLTVKAGVGKDVIRDWTHRRFTPRLENLEACLQVLGYELVIQKRAG